MNNARDGLLNKMQWRQQRSSRPGRLCWAYAGGASERVPSSRAAHALPTSQPSQPQRPASPTLSLTGQACCSCYYLLHFACPLSPLPSFSSDLRPLSLYIHPLPHAPARPFQPLHAFGPCVVPPAALSLLSHAWPNRCSQARPHVFCGVTASPRLVCRCFPPTTYICPSWPGAFLPQSILCGPDHSLA